MDELVDLLDRECELVEDLNFRLMALRLASRDPDGHHARRAAADVDVALAAVRDMELLRAMEVDGLRCVLGIEDPTPGLRDLIAQVPEANRERVTRSAVRLQQLATELEAIGSAPIPSLRDFLDNLASPQA